MKKNVLVFPCGSEIGLDVYHSVKYDTHFHLIGASSVEDHGSFVYEDYIPDVPMVSDPLFINAIQSIVSEREIDAIYPTMDSVISVLKSHESSIGCKVIASPEETTRICLSKRRTYDKLYKDIRTPNEYQIDDPLEFPVFVKPDIGYGSRGTAIVYDHDSLYNTLTRQTDLLILEYLPGDEYTVDCFTNRHGVLLYSAARQRNRIRGGISVNTSFVENQEEFKRIAQIINSKLSFRGAWFFQIKKDKNGELCLLELASRIGGSSLLSNSIGINLALMTLYDAFDIDVYPLANREYTVILDRALSSQYRCKGIKFDTVYVDYDDCLILNGTDVNIDLVRFLFKCVNDNKELVLLTKHDGIVEDDLRRFRLENLFDRIIHLERGKNKADFVDKKEAIFIDDSFAERRNIKEEKGIPVFSPDMIDVLL